MQKFGFPMDVRYEEMVWQMDVLHLLHGVSTDSSVDEAFLHHSIQGQVRAQFVPFGRNMH